MLQDAGLSPLRFVYWYTHIEFALFYFNITIRNTIQGSHIAMMNALKQNAATSTPVESQPWEVKWKLTCSRVAYFSVNYVISAVLLSILFPLSQQFLAPLLSSVIPISHTSLPKAFLVMTLMYWLPITIDIIRRWRSNTC